MQMTTPSAMFDPRALVGVELRGGWRIDTLVERNAEQTGGNFSIGYLGSDENGRRGFIKVINYYKALFSVDPTLVLQEITEGYNFERDLVERCGLKKLSRVVAAFEHDSIRVPGQIFPVSYIIFELADHDVRRALDLDRAIDLTAKLRLAHNATAGAAQLHGIGVAHQDIKPSNLLVFPSERSRDRSSKLTDLGRASDQSTPARHDSYVIAGDPTYAPPEQLYGVVKDSFEERRLACDVYQTGNLIAYILTGSTVNARIHAFLDPQHSPNNWGGSYDEVLAYVQAAHSAAIYEINAELAGPLGLSISKLIQQLTDPDIGRRGHPRSVGAKERFALNRVVTDLDLLSRRSAVLAVRDAQ